MPQQDPSTARVYSNATLNTSRHVMEKESTWKHICYCITNHPQNLVAWNKSSHLLCLSFCGSGIQIGCNMIWRLDWGWRINSYISNLVLTSWFHYMCVSTQGYLSVFLIRWLVSFQMSNPEMAISFMICSQKLHTFTYGRKGRLLLLWQGGPSGINTRRWESSKLRTECLCPSKFLCWSSNHRRDGFWGGTFGKS